MAEQDRKKSHGKQPISRHPLFPVTIVLWFSALFVLASLALRPALESVALAAQIDTLVPAAARPLGESARILLALAMAGIGGVIGVLAVRRMIGPKPVANERDDDAMIGNEVPRRLDKPHIAQSFEAEGRPDEGQCRDGSKQGPPRRRRALAIMEEDEAGFDGHERARPSGGEAQTLDPQVLDVAEVGLQSFDAAGEDNDAEAASRDDDTLDLVGYASVVFEALRDTSDAPAVAPEQSTAASPEGGHEGDEPNFALPMDEPMANVSAEDEDTIASTCEDDAGKDARPGDPDSEGPADFGPTDPCAAERIVSADLSALSHVELLERLALSLKRRWQVAAAPATSTTTEQQASPAQDFAGDDEDEFEAQILEDGYSSLLDLKRRDGSSDGLAEGETPDAWRSDGSRAGPEPRDSEEIERALRVALANLQKISKAV